MKSGFLIGGIVSLCTALLCFFLLSIATNLPLYDQAGVAERVIPIYLLVQSVALITTAFYLKK